MEDKRRINLEDKAESKNKRNKAQQNKTRRAGVVPKQNTNPSLLVKTKQKTKKQDQKGNKTKQNKTISKKDDQLMQSQSNQPTTNARTGPKKGRRGEERGKKQKAGKS